MEHDYWVESEPPDRRRRPAGQRRVAEVSGQSRMDAWFALKIGLPVLLFWCVMEAVSDSLAHSFAAGFWRVVHPWMTVCCLVVVLVCGAILAWNLYLFWLTHKERQGRLKLLDQYVSVGRQIERVIRGAYTRGDNIEVQFDAATGAPRGMKVTPQAVMLEHLRQQELERARQAAAAQFGQSVVLKPGETAIFPGDGYRRIESEIAPLKQIAAPGGFGGESRASAPAGGRKTPARSSSADEELAEKLARIPAPSKPGSIQTFAELLDEGVIQAALAEGLIALGYVRGDAGVWALRFGTWLDLYSCGVGGVTGSGKTTTVRFLLFQAILAGARLLMVDPHIHEPAESLAAQFSMFKNVHLQKPCDDTPERVAKRIRWFMHEYIRRKARGIKGPAYIFVLDEFNEIIALLPAEVKKELAELMLRIAQSGRKFGLFMMVIGQRWSEQDLGGKPYGAAIRTSLAATLTHRFTDQQQAMKLAGGHHAAECLELDQGHYYFRDTHGGMSYTITPDTVAEDGVEIQQILDELENTVESTFETGEKTPRTLVSRDTGPLESQPVASVEEEFTPETTRIYTLARQVVRLQAENVQKPEIMRRIWGVNPGGTEAYQQALEEYKTVMQFLAERLERNL